MPLKIQRNHADMKTWNFQLLKRGKGEEGHAARGQGAGRHDQSLDCLGQALPGQHQGLAGHASALTIST